MKLSQAQLCLLIAGETETLGLTMLMKRRKKYKKEFFKLHPELFTSAECQLLFRFDKSDMFDLCEALKIPNSNTCQKGTKFSGIEGKF